MNTANVMTKRLVSRPAGSSEFQLHKSTLVLPSETSRKNIADFTEHKLRKMILSTPESERRRALLGLLADYQLGKIAVAWQDGGNPIYITIKKD